MNMDSPIKETSGVKKSISKELTFCDFETYVSDINYTTIMKEQISFGSEKMKLIHYKKTI